MVEAEIIAFLSDPATYAGPPSSVDQIETHAARVFLAGREALKIKRPVRYSYLDFSTSELRHKALERELEINRPAAPAIYRDVVAIVRTSTGALALGGEGEVVDWALRMHRFDGDKLLSALAAQGPLSKELVHALARSVADNHQHAPRVVLRDGGTRAMRQIVGELRHELGRIAPATVVGRFLDSVGMQLETAAVVLDQRAAAGFVRRCHGDLHLGNIVLIGDRPVLFDALEFDEELATVDTLYDLAFLVMDLDYRGQREAANLLLNRYLVEIGEDAHIDGLAAMPLFLALRAAIRGMTELQRGDAEAITRGRAYLEAATRYATPGPARLVAVGGFSGTGKSTLAAALAPELDRPPGAMHLRSDIERKRLMGVPELERLPAESYTPMFSERVYGRLLDKASRALTAGQSVIVDAVYAVPTDRHAVEALAGKLGVPFSGLWLTAPPATLAQRVSARRADASDADASVVARQLDQVTGHIGWSKVDAGSIPAATLAAARAALASPSPDKE